MKLDPHLPQLPSIGELLEHPRVKGVVERINRSTLAQRAAGFLDELRGSLATKADGETPTLAHLAERLARRLLGEPVDAAGSVINATGVVLGDPALAPPLAERSLHAIFQQAAEYQRDDVPWRNTLGQEICELIGSEAAHATPSFETALMLAMAGAASGREAHVCGAVPPSPDDAVDWQRLAARSGTVLRHVGANASTTAAAAIVRAPDMEADISLSALAAAAKQPKPTLVDAAPAAGIFDPAAHGFQSVETIAQRLAAGADLVVVDGAGLLGGPACGLIIGRRRLVNMIQDHPLASLAAIDRLTAAALSAVIQAYREDATAPVIFQLPVWQLLSAPLDNLRQCAERLAPLMAESPAVAAAESRQFDSAWRRWGGRQWQAASWGILLTPQDGDCQRLRTQLARAPYPIIARQADGAVAIDLRATFPRWDQRLVEVVAAIAR